MVDMVPGVMGVFGVIAANKKREKERKEYNVNVLQLTLYRPILTINLLFHSSNYSILYKRQNALISNTSDMNSL